MNVYIYIDIYRCICLDEYMCVWVCACMSIFMYEHKYEWVHACIFMYIYEHMHVWTYLYVSICMNIYVHIHIHTFNGMMLNWDATKRKADNWNTLLRGLLCALKAFVHCGNWCKNTCQICSTSTTKDKMSVFLTFDLIPIVNRIDKYY